MDLNKELKLLLIFKKNNRGGGVESWGVRLGVSGGCERRSEVFVKKSKKKSWGSGQGGVGGWGQDGFEQRTDFYFENSKKKIGWVGWVVGGG